MGGIKRPGEPGADEVGLVESTSQGTSKRLRQSPPTSPCTGAQPAGVCPICRCLLVQKCERVALARLPPPAPRSSASALLFLLLAPALPRPTGNQCRSTGMQVSPCMLSFGGCGCVYHEHCVSHWLLKRNVCPVHESPSRSVSEYGRHAPCRLSREPRLRLRAPPRPTATRAGRARPPRPAMQPLWLWAGRGTERAYLTSLRGQRACNCPCMRRYPRRAGRHLGTPHAHLSPVRAVPARLARGSCPLCPPWPLGGEGSQAGRGEGRSPRTNLDADDTQTAARREPSPSPSPAP